MHIFLDSGSRYNKVNAALLPDAPRETKELPQGDINRWLEVHRCRCAVMSKRGWATARRA